MGIGNYGDGDDNATPARNLVSGFEEGLKQDIQDAEGVVERSLSYEERLELAGLTKEKASEILDAILLEGTYKETIPLTDRVSVTFRSRIYRDMIRYHQMIERKQPKYVAERDELKLRYYLAASLDSFRGTTYHGHDDPNDAAAEMAFEERLAVIAALPAPLVHRLGNELNKFDIKCTAALNDGAVEFF